MDAKSADFDTVLGLCQNRHCRIILAVLANERRSLTVNDLTKTIVKHDHRTSIVDASEEVRRGVRLSVSSVYVPKLKEKGVVEYDSERRLVEPAAAFDRLQPHLSAIVSADPGLEEPVEL